MSSKYPTNDVRHYKENGFIKVCDVAMGERGTWVYHNIKKDYLFSEHSSWVYFVVDDNEIVKIGESGNPLGIKPKTEISVVVNGKNEPQPVANSTSRFGRLRRVNNTQFDTDMWIRQNLLESVRNNKVSLWAKKCDTVYSDVQVGNKTEKIMLAMHKELEQSYLAYFQKHNYSLPRLNKHHR